MNKRTPAEWGNILSQVGVTPTAVAKWAWAFSDFFQGELFSSGDDELPEFLAQILHESNRLKSLEEDLRYSVSGMRRVWPNRFPDDESAEPFVFKPASLACRVYNGRLGNHEATDGWDFRGSGLIQITGRSNFEAIRAATGIDCVTTPGLLRTPGIEALKVAHAWWEQHVPDEVMGNPVRVRKAVNGGTIGLDDTTKLAEQLRGIL